MPRSIELLALALATLCHYSVLSIQSWCIFVKSMAKKTFWWQVIKVIYVTIRFYPFYWVDAYLSKKAWQRFIKSRFLKLSNSSFCVLRWKSCELSHVIFLKLRKIKLLSKLSKFIEWHLFSLKTTIWVMIVAISVNLLSLANNHLQDWKVNTFLSFSGER